ncbi:MAG: hypothetical protein Q7S85_02815 [Rugosibacter sp.]|nr:hypothetical protein [Rugosibacter sp.]
MIDLPTLPPDALAVLAPPEIQRHAARMAQDAFTQVFRLTLAGDAAALQLGVAEMEPLCRNWARAAADDEARALRLALLATGLDQWGLAYGQAFGLVAIPGLTALLGSLRNGLDAVADARFQRQFAAIEAEEGAAVDFKMELRRSIHLALWHAMLACETEDEAEPVLAALGSLLWALVLRMPQLGWRLAADTLAHIQIRCLAEGAAATGLAQEMNQRLFQSLRQSLPEAQGTAIFAQANQAAIAWQRARTAGGAGAAA